jgi:diguanylate cyclase (GGDEF)-like protein
MSRTSSVAIIFGTFFLFTLAHFSSQYFFLAPTQWHDVFVKFLFIPVVLAAYAWGLRGGLWLGSLAAVVEISDLSRWCGPNHPEFYGKIAEIFLFVGVGCLLGRLRDIRERAPSAQIRDERRAEDRYRKSIMDPLTHAYNRNFMQKMLQSHFEDAQQHGHIFSLLMLDLNRFKTINDRHGHPAGDRVLQSTVQTIVNQVRKTDLICRFGGDEFLVILPNCKENQAVDLALRLRHEMAKVTFSNVRGPFKADFSVGVVGFRKEYESLTKMLAKLDEVLNRAKREESCVAKAG